MFKKMLILFMCLCYYNGIAQDIQLSMPRTNFQMAMVSKEDVKLLEYDFRMENAAIRYTVDGSEPIKNSKLYQGPIKISQPCTIKAKTFHPDFKASESCSTIFILKGEKPLNLSASEANSKYKGNGVASLIDGIFGAMTFDDKYLGYDINVVELGVHLDSNKLTTSFNMAYLINQQAWIFGPQRVSIYDQNDHLVVEKKYAEVDKKCTPNHLILSIKLPARKYSYLKIFIEPLSIIPEWHPGSGRKSWFFTDEIWFY